MISLLFAVSIAADASLEFPYRGKFNQNTLDTAAVYAECVLNKTDRFELSAEPVSIIVEAAFEACKNDRKVLDITIAEEVANSAGDTIIDMMAGKKAPEPVPSSEEIMRQFDAHLTSKARLRLIEIRSEKAPR